jgi:hydrogenase expression/formation protein HypC
MCLALPVKVIALGAGEMAIVDLGGVRKEISLALLDDVQVGDYVILHVGYALSKLDPEEAEKTLELFAQLQAIEREEIDNKEIGNKEVDNKGIGNKEVGNKKVGKVRP